MNWILRVDDLSKVYRLGAGATQQGTLYEQLSKKVKKLLPGKKLSSEDNEENFQKSSGRVVVSDAQTEGLPQGFFWALKNISFQITPGERIGLIGQNGSGKSTLLKILSRITAPTYGEFRYRGHLISLLEVGTGFHPELTGRENIYLNAAINGMTRQQINARFKEIVEFSELGNQIDTPVKRYSSGMYMRLAFSVAAFLESEILLIDEVLAVGDQDFQKKCKEKMLEVANDGRSVIFVSHDMSAIESICKKTIEISHGEIVAIKDIEFGKRDKDKGINQIIDIRSSQVLDSNVEYQKDFDLRAKCEFKVEPEKAAYKSAYVKLVSCQLMNDKGFLQEKYSPDENINLEIKFKVLQANTRINVRVDLSTMDGVIIFSSIDNAYFQSKKIERVDGLYKEIVTIPRNYLNEGQFSISIYIGDLEAGKEIVFCKDCLSLKIVDEQISFSEDSKLTHSLPKPLLRSNFSWKIECCNDARDEFETESLIEYDVSN
ncbi:polysaccharide ABC transporter ATP-binding protein [Legionella pneumophila serogroup 2]